jgi:hypothetical protein
MTLNRIVHVIHYHNQFPATNCGSIYVHPFHKEHKLVEKIEYKKVLPLLVKNPR